MRAAFIVSAYHRPELLSRLLASLDGRPVAVHIDKKSQHAAELRAVIRAHANASELPSHVCRWGHFGHVRASLEGLKWFLGTEADHVFLLTGQCFPLFTVNALEQGLHGLGNRSLMESAPFPKQEWMAGEDGGFERLRYFRLVIGGKTKTVKAWPRHIPRNLKPYGGSGYWSMSRHHAEYVGRFAPSNSDVARFFSTTWIPDEVYFQTVLSNSEFRSELVDWKMHYVTFRDGEPRPESITEPDLGEAAKQKCLFARKLETLEMMESADAMRLSRTDMPNGWLSAALAAE